MQIASGRVCGVPLCCPRRTLLAGFSFDFAGKVGEQKGFLGFRGQALGKK
jgi:hypothetical protein